MDEFSAEDSQYFKEEIVAWGKAHGRVFPWRETRNPYHILVAEMMLRRTRALQVVPVYHHFLDRFPSVEDLAAASETEVAQILYPLGLAWRAANFCCMAHQVISEHNGQIPREREHLLSLNGVGDYVASAVRCIAFNENETLIDTNSVRVAGRYFGFSTHAESRRNQKVRHAVGRLTDHKQPRVSNLALLDFAALICRAPIPLCEQCPVRGRCRWFREQRLLQPVVPDNR